MTGTLAAGTVVAQVAYQNYAGVTAAGTPDAGSALAAKHARAGRSAMPTYHLITVRNGATWKIYASAVMDVRSGQREQVRSSEPFHPRPTKLVALFDAI